MPLPQPRPRTCKISSGTRFIELVSFPNYVPVIETCRLRFRRRVMILSAFGTAVGFSTWMIDSALSP